jgi:PTS system mannose-specific IIA component
MPESASSEALPTVGVVLVAHGNTASALLAAARNIAGPDALGDHVEAVDAGVGRSDELDAKVCDSIQRADSGRGVLLIVDLLGSSPCACGLSQGMGHRLAMVTGLNLAMLLKLSSLDRSVATAAELADACKASGQKAVTVKLQGAGCAPEASPVHTGGETVG